MCVCVEVTRALDHHQSSPWFKTFGHGKVFRSVSSAITVTSETQKHTQIIPYNINTDIE